MPRKIKFQEIIPALMSRNTYEAMILVWVQSRVSFNPNFKITTAVHDFLAFYHIPMDYWDYKTAEQFVYKALSEDEEMKWERLTTKINNYGKQS